MPGPLGLDADRPNALTAADKGHLILIPGGPAAGFAQDEGCPAGVRGVDTSAKGN